MDGEQNGTQAQQVESDRIDFALQLAEAHVKWLRAVKSVCANSTAYKRAVCAACEAFCEFGAGVRFDEAQRESDGEHRSADNGSGVVFVDAVNTAGAFPWGAALFTIANCALRLYR